MNSIKIYNTHLIFCIVAISLFACTHSNKLTVAFTEVRSLKKGSKVYAGEKIVGQVKSWNPSHNLDIIFIELQIANKIQIPKGSIFYIDENLIGDSQIMVEYSNNKSYLSNKDTCMGQFRALKKQY